MASADVSAWERLSNAGLKAALEGRLEDAEAAFKAALEEAEKDGVRRRIVLSLENLGDFYRRVDRLAEAETMHLRALRVAESMRGRRARVVAVLHAHHAAHHEVHAERAGEEREYAQ